MRRLVIRLLGIALAGIASASAWAQIGVPVPAVPLPVDVPGTLGAVTDRVGVDRLIDARRREIASLLRQHRRELDTDPAGELIVRREVLAFDPTEVALGRAVGEGFAIVRDRDDELLGRVVVLAAPENWTARRALRRLRKLDPEGSYDYNHVLGATGVVDSGAAEGPPSIGVPAIARSQTTLPIAVAATQGVSITAGSTSVVAPRVGLIDSGVDFSHPQLSAAARQTSGCDGQSVPSAHGTGVASLLLDTARAVGAAPMLYAADVYCGAPTGGATDEIVAAFGWMARERVPVINVSLVGPRNIVMERVVARVVARGHVIVAAVGNDGPAAKPLYPASYPGVVGVTGVDARKRVLLEACRGPQVDVASYGSGLRAASLEGRTAEVRGTSFAAPIVAGLLAGAIEQPDTTRAATAVAQLLAKAEDLGTAGPDPVYGNGLVSAGAGSVAR